jgi:spore coat-associated protein N
MSRIHVLFSQPKLALGALLTLLLAAGAVVGSGADFTASSANPSNTFASGTLSIDNSNEGVAILTASNLRPGGPGEEGVVDIENTGSLSGAFTLTRSAPADTGSTSPLSQKLNVTVTDCGTYSGATAPDCGDGDDDPIYSGTLADMGTSGHAIAALGDYAADDKHRYRFTVALDDSAGDAYQGGESSVEFNFTAAS